MDKHIEDLIKDTNKCVAQKLFGLNEPADNYAGSFNGAWIVMHRMKVEDPIVRIHFFEAIQALTTKGCGIQSGVLSLSDALFYTTPLIICLAALSVIASNNTTKGDNVIQLRRKSK